MPTELELCVVSAIVGALLGGGVTYTVAHKIDGAALAHEQAAHASDIARINATAAQQLVEALAKGQVAEGQVATIQQQYETEVAQHAKDNLDYQRKLIAGTERVRVHVTGCSVTGTASESTPAAPGANDAPAVAELSPSTAASVVAIADDADATAARLAALQDYIRKMQDAGYINR
jgi:hypothetical protein